MTVQRDVGLQFALMTEILDPKAKSDRSRRKSMQWRGNHRVRLSNLANLDNFVSLQLLGIAWRVVHGFWLPEFSIT